VRTQIARYRGREVKTVGDGFVAGYGTFSGQRDGTLNLVEHLKIT